MLGGPGCFKSNLWGLYSVCMLDYMYAYPASGCQSSLEKTVGVSVMKSRQDFMFCLKQLFYVSTRTCPGSL